MTRSLDAYLHKRDFAATPEPSDPGTPAALALRYSVQKHEATRLHFDLRLEWEGVLLSWAVTRGPSFDPAEKRLAVRTEDHPLSYLTFEGVIPAGSYGAGRVMLWDLGHWQPLADVGAGLRKGHLHLALHGRRLTGRWNLIRMKGSRKGDAKRENWLLIKEEDDAAHQEDPVPRYDRSILTGRGFDDIAAGSAARAPDPRRRGANPRFRKPQLATLTDGPPAADPARWHEVKLDGYRALVSLGRTGARIFTRNGHDWSDRFAPLLPPLAELPADTALLDGEIVAGAGLQGFTALQKAIEAGGPYTLYAFDLLHRDGADLASQPLRDRRRALEDLMRDAVPEGPLRLSPLIEGDPAAPFAAICGAGGEGLIAKQTDAPYRGGRSRAWLKIKCERRMEMAIVGWQPSDKRGRAFSSLLLATRDGKDWVYRGKVGTGFDGAAQQDLADRMAPLARDRPPLKVDRAEARGVRWLEPRLVAEVKFAELTGEGRVRHAVFLGLREDKEAVQVTLEKEEPGDRVQVAGIGISHPDRAVYPKPKITKLDVARYYEAVAGRLLAEAADRPLSLVRLPEGIEGERFFQKHAGRGFPAALRKVPIPESDGGTADYMYVSDAAGLVGAAQMGTLEFHIWGARRDRLDRPDRLVFDLDPDEGLGFAEVRRAAVELRDELAELGLGSWAMVTGGKGVHVVVPLRRVAGWETVKLFAKTFAALAAERRPERYTATMSKAKRRGRIFLDWLRNERGATAIAPFSLRARPGAPVAVPVGWDELARLRRADGFGMKAALDRGWGAIDRPKPAGLSEAVIAGLEDRFR
ncbi:MAG: DNA ligase D [Tranquillimonas sp.]